MIFAIGYFTFVVVFLPAVVTGRPVKLRAFSKKYRSWVLTALCCDVSRGRLSLKEACAQYRDRMGGYWFLFEHVNTLYRVAMRALDRGVYKS